MNNNLLISWNILIETTNTLIKSPIFIALSAFLIGVFSGDLFSIHWVLTFTIWATFILILVVVLAFGEQQLFFRKWLSWNVVIVLFLSGMLGYQLKMPISYESQFNALYLENDQLIGEIVDYQKGNGDYDKAIVAVQQVVKPHANVYAQGELLCYIKIDKKTFSEGNIILFQPNLQIIENKNNPGEFDAVQYWRVKGINTTAFVGEESITELGTKQTFTGFWKRSREYLIDIIKSKVSESNQGLVIALTLGDKSKLSIEKRTQFANAGAMHVLAVSGMHVGILLAFLQFLFYQFKPFRKRNLYLYFALVLIWAFAFLTGMSASVARAVTMFSLLAIGQLLGKKFFSIQAIFASALLLLIINPLFLFDIGFQLSYLAVLGIALFYRSIINLFHSSYKVFNYFWQGTAIGVAAQIGTLPLTLYYFNQFPNYFLLTNIGVLILASIALISVVLLLLFHAIPYLIDWISSVVNLTFDLFTLFIKWINSLPGEVSTGFTPNIIQVFLLYLTIGFTLYFWKMRKLKAFRLGTTFLFALGLTLIVNREYNKSKEELIVLNHYHKTILIKSNRQLFLIYDDSKSTTVESLDFLVRGYENTVGLKAEVLPLKEGYELKLIDNIYLQSSKEGWLINYHDKRYFLANTVNKKVKKLGESIVKGPWSPYIKSDLIDLNMEKEALIVKGVGYSWQ